MAHPHVVVLFFIFTLFITNVFAMEPVYNLSVEEDKFQIIEENMQTIEERFSPTAEEDLQDIMRTYNYVIEQKIIHESTKMTTMKQFKHYYDIYTYVGDNNFYDYIFLISREKPYGYVFRSNNLGSYRIVKMNGFNRTEPNPVMLPWNSYRVPLHTLPLFTYIDQKLDPTNFEVGHRSIFTANGKIVHETKHRALTRGIFTIMAGDPIHRISSRYHQPC